ncbi:MAG TPA: hypothetical protein VFV49_04005 [Thermoanaerobaculia bacterium]|nr:hypothetical protein [Thermoanaerobaculia bacterium]
MSLMTVCVTPSPITQLIVLICFFWPFIAMSLLSRQGRSAGPVAAVLVPLGFFGAGTWLGLIRVMEVRALFGGGSHAVAAGIAEALAMLYIGGFFAAAVIVFAAIRRHRPFVDRMTAALLTVLIASLTAALFSAAVISNGSGHLYLFLTAAIVTAVVAMVAMVWTYLTGRGRVPSAPIPHGVPVATVLIVVMGVVIWELAHGYTMFAMGR